MNDNAEVSKRWVSAFETGHDYEADMVRDRLDENGLPAVVFTQRDHTFNLTIGDLAPIHVMVQLTDLDEALSILSEALETETDLDDASMNADPNAKPAHDEDFDSLLDSSLERLRFVSPDDQADSEPQT